LVWCTFLGEGIEGVGGGGVGGEEVAIAAFDVVVVDATSFGSDGGFDAVAFADEEVPAENLGEAVHHVVELFVLHVHQRAHGEAELGDLGRRVVADAVGLEEVLKTAELAGRRPGGVVRRGDGWRGDGIVKERRRGPGRRCGWEDGSWVPLE